MQLSATLQFPSQNCSCSVLSGT